MKRKNTFEKVIIAMHGTRENKKEISAKTDLVERSKCKVK